MPYVYNNDLPASVKDNLPDAAQTIFREAFNNAHTEYGNDLQAFKVAWAAVKKGYVKSENGRWVKKN